ncbi:hypothetical protein EON73_03845 [bacterium]|nr:MAG: hypothetical protein EON73_03845 [bacterium]
MENLNEIIYSLCIEDIQNVAEQEIDRELTSEEIESIKDLVSANIDWYGAIADAISEKINAVESSS